MAKVADDASNSCSWKSFRAIMHGSSDEQERGKMMSLRAVSIGIDVSSGLAMAQAPASRDLQLRGDRFKPLTYDKLTPEQKVMVANLFSGERGGMNGPFNVMLRSPEMGDQAQKLGARLRFHSSMPNRLNELAILVTARFWTAQYEWSAHRRRALAEGLSPAIIDAIAAGRRPTSMQPDEEAVYNFASEFYATKQVSDATFKTVVDKFGGRGGR